jgi:hypothetical protein
MLNDSQVLVVTENGNENVKLVDDGEDVYRITNGGKG